MFYLATITRWVSHRDSCNRVAPLDKSDGRQFLINTDRIEEMTVRGTGARFKYFELSEDPREAFDLIETTDSVAELIVAGDDTLVSNVVTLPVFRKNDPAKATTDTTINVDQFIYADAYNPNSNYSWVVYEQDDFKRVEVLVDYTLAELVAVVSAVNGDPTDLDYTISSVNLTWTNGSTNEDGISIERSIDGITYAEIATVGAGIATYSDSPSTFSDYYYRVRAFKSDTYSEYSNVVHITEDELWTQDWNPPNKTLLLTSGAGGDGTIFEDSGTYYLRGVRDKNFLIIGYDFPDDWTKGIPYKSVCTISAPAGDAELIAMDVNNFLYDGTGTPNQIPVVSCFQNIDYEAVIFFKHGEQVLDGDGVETYEPRVLEWAIYPSAQTGADLTTCQTYYGVPSEDINGKWVTASGNDTTGDGTKTKPYLTIAKATSSFNTGQKVYYKTQNPFTLATGYFINSLNNNMYFIGLCKIIPTDGSYLFRLTNANINNVSGLVAIRQAADNCILNIDNGGNLVFKRNFIQLNLGQYIGQTGKTFQNNVFAGIYTSGVGVIRMNNPTANILIDTNLFCGTLAGADVEYVAGSVNLTITNNKHIGTLRTDGGSTYLITKTITGDVLIKGNYVRLKNGATNRIVYGCAGNLATTDYVLEICYNTIYVDYEDYKTAELKDHQINVPHFHHNNITYTVGDVVPVCTFHAGNMLAEYNIIYCPVLIGGGGSDGEDDFSGEAINGEIFSASLTQTVRYNKIKSNRLNDGHIKIGYQVSTDSDNKVVSSILGNHISGYGTFNSAIAGTAYGVYIGNQRDADVRYNFIKGIYYGIHISGNYANTSNGVLYNIIRNFVTGIRIEGFDDVVITNNTLITEYDTATGLHNDTGSDGTIFKNNIVILLGSGNNYGVKVQNGTTNDIDYNIYYCPNGTLLFSDGTNRTFAQWQALGYDTHSIVLTDSQYLALFTDLANDDFTLKAGSIAIGGGENLGVAYDDGFDSSTDWGNDDETPTIVTKQQGASWDVGAYIHQ